LFALTQGYVVASRYEILATLGQGGMGTVYKAHDRELDEFVALKVLRGDFATHPEIAKRFRSEIKLARRIRHKNVCGIHEYGQEGHLRYIAMEFISGVDFRRVLLERGPLPQEEAFDVSIQIAHGLQAIHEEGIVHRDLKTPNIMRDTRGVVRLMDFGIAKQWDSDGGTNLTAVGQVVGTPEYMSPEQVRAGKIDFRSDIYALGIVIFELFTGRVPFRGATPVVTLFQQLNDPPPLGGPASARLPKALIPVIRQALAKDAADRYLSASDLAQALGTAQRASASRAEPGSLTKPILTTTAPDLQPRPTPTAVPTQVPTQVPALTPASSSFAPTATAPAQAARPEPPAARVAATPPLPPVRHARPFVASPRARWLAVVTVLAVGVVSVAGVGVVIYQRAQRQAETATPVVQTLDRPAPQAVEPARSPSTTLAATVRPPDLVSHVAPMASPVPRLTPAPSAPEPSRSAAAPAVSVQPRASTSSASNPPGPAPPVSTHAAAPVAQLPANAEGASPVAKPATGFLQLAVRPYADVIVDGNPAGTTPLKALTLAAGQHSVRLVNPEYQPFKRTITIRPDETTKLEVDFPLDGIPKR
jgi:serine/threonine-protein kinase